MKKHSDFVYAAHAKSLIFEFIPCILKYAIRSLNVVIGKKTKYFISTFEYLLGNLNEYCVCMVCNVMVIKLDIKRLNVNDLRTDTVNHRNSYVV